MKITFFGAARTVTGSKHMVRTGNFNLLLDCGLYQGPIIASEQMNRALPFLASEVDAVILSHAHLDHSGMLPVLVRDGFRGKIYCTPATAEIAKYILHDSVVVQTQHCKRHNHHLKRGDRPIFPLYTDDDVLKTLSHFETIPYFRTGKEWTELNGDVRFKFYDAGHILGSAVTLLEARENGSVKTLGYTGDLGRAELPILRSPEYAEENMEILLEECTYGERVHRPIAEASVELKDIVGKAVQNKSKIIIPAFSLGRTQELVYMLHKLVHKNIIGSIPIYIDSPLAENLTKIYPHYIDDFDEDYWKDFGNQGQSPFYFKNIVYARTIEESKAINAMEGPLLVITASGMAEGGRLLHHLKHNIGNPNSIILITGYQAEHTLGRKIRDGVSPVRIFGEDHDVRARIAVLNELSAHADQNILLSYASHYKELRKLFLVHTELPQALAYKKIVEKNMPSLAIDIPLQGQSVEI